MKTVLRLLAPYIAVIPFWCLYRNAWLCIAVYHVQALMWSHRELARRARGWDRKAFLIGVLPCALAGPAVYFLLPVMVKGPSLASWLGDSGLGGLSLLAMIPYFGLLHPMIEQAHWSEVRATTHWAHLAFAGYHVLVLWSLLSPIWLALCFAVLLGASIAWAHLQGKTRGGLLVPYGMHAVADLGIVLAAWAIASRA